MLNSNLIDKITGFKGILTAIEINDATITVLYTGDFNPATADNLGLAHGWWARTWRMLRGTATVPKWHTHIQQQISRVTDFAERAYGHSGHTLMAAHMCIYILAHLLYLGHG